MNHTYETKYKLFSYVFFYQHESYILFTTTITQSISDQDFYNIEIANLRLKDLKDKCMYQFTLGEPSGEFYPEIGNSSCLISVDQSKNKEVTSAVLSTKSE